MTTGNDEWTAFLGKETNVYKEPGQDGADLGGRLPVVDAEPVVPVEAAEPRKRKGRTPEQLAVARALKKSRKVAVTTMTRMELRESLLLRDGVRLGDVMEAWQREDFEALDDPQYRHAYLERPRGHDKSGAAGTEIILHLLKGPNDSQIISVAMDKEQTMIVFNDVAQKLRRGGYEARREVRILADTIVAKKTGSVYTAMPSDAPSAWGLRPDLVVVDEVEEIVKRDLWDALYSALIKNPRSRVLVIGTAGYSKDSLAWELRTLAQREPRWYFKSRGQCATWLDQEDLAEQRRVLRPHVFARLHLNEWVDNVGAWLTFAEVDACFGDVPLGRGRKVVALDLGVKRDLAVLAVVDLDDDFGIYTVEYLKAWEAPEGGEIDLIDVQATAERRAREEGYCPIVLDPWQGVLMAQQIRYNNRERRREIKVVDDAITDRSRNAGFVFLADIVRARRFRSRPSAALRSEMLGMELEVKPGGRYRVDHKTGKHDDHVFAVSLGCLYLGREQAPPPPKTFQGYVTDERTGNMIYKPPSLAPAPGPAIPDWQSGDYVVARERVGVTGTTGPAKYAVRVASAAEIPGAVEAIRAEFIRRHGPLKPGELPDDLPDASYAIKKYGNPPAEPEVHDTRRFTIDGTATDAARPDPVVERDTKVLGRCVACRDDFSAATLGPGSLHLKCGHYAYGAWRD